VTQASLPAIGLLSATTLDKREAGAFRKAPMRCS
jgi:hypothetical protein